MRGSSMYGGAEEGYEVYMFPVPQEEEGHGERYTPAKIRSPSQGSLRVVLSFGGALPPRVSPCAHREEARMCLCERNVNVQRL